MDDVSIYLFIIGASLAPFVLLWQLVKLWRVPPSSRASFTRLKLVRYLALTVCVMYSLAVFAIWIYFWLLFEPNISPTNSFDAENQRWLGILMGVGTAFLFSAPVAAASLLTLRSMVTPQKK